MCPSEGCVFRDKSPDQKDAGPSIFSSSARFRASASILETMSSTSTPCQPHRHRPDRQRPLLCRNPDRPLRPCTRARPHRRRRRDRRRPHSPRRARSASPPRCARPPGAPAWWSPPAAPAWLRATSRPRPRLPSPPGSFPALPSSFARTARAKLPLPPLAAASASPLASRSFSTYPAAPAARKAPCAPSFHFFPTPSISWPDTPSIQPSIRIILPGGRIEIP